MSAGTGTTEKLVSERINRIGFSSTLVIVAEAAKLRAQGADIVDFGAGEPFFPTPRHIKDAGIAAIEQDKTKYTAVAGIPPLRAAITERHRADFGSDYSPEECIFSTGGKLALFNSLQAIVDHGDEVIIPVPYWVSFKDIVQYAGGKCVYLPTREGDGFQLTAAMVERAITPRTRAIILNTPNNPSGAVFPEAEVRKIAALAARHNFYIVSDECYAYINYAGKPFSLGSLKEHKQHIVVVGSLSKTYAMTGWRSGYALAPAALTAAFNKLQSQSTSSSSAVTQYAALAAMTGPQDCIAQFRNEYQRLRDLTLAGLKQIPGITCTQPDGAFYAYFNVSKFLGPRGAATPADLANRLLREKQVVVIPGEGFGTEQHLRLSYAVSQKDLERGLARMKEFFAAL